MGYIRHHVIVVTGTHGEHIKRAHRKATEIFNEIMVGGYSCNTFVSLLQEGTVNEIRSFCIFPDGSKEGWKMSDEGDTARARFIEWLTAQRYEDGSSPLDWVFVKFGDGKKHLMCEELGVENE